MVWPSGDQRGLSSQDLPSVIRVQRPPQAGTTQRTDSGALGAFFAASIVGMAESCLSLCRRDLVMLRNLGVHAKDNWRLSAGKYARRKGPRWRSIRTRDM